MFNFRFFGLKSNIMKTMRTLLILAVAALSSVSLSAQDYRITNRDGYRYEGEWPSGDGVLYSYETGLVIGTFHKGKPNGRCVCYKPNGEVYWGDFKKGKATGKGRIYRDNGIVVTGDYKNGRYHGIDTLFRSNGTTLVGKFKKGKMKGVVAHEGDAPGMTRTNRPPVAKKPLYPMMDLRTRQEDFLKELELMWEERNLMLIRKAGMVPPRFQGGNVDDFALWVNSQISYPVDGRLNRDDRTVIVEFTVLKDGSVADVVVSFGSDSVLNEIAVKAVTSSPKWTPGEQNGEKKNVRLSVPVVFSLQ